MKVCTSGTLLMRDRRRERKSNSEEREREKGIKYSLDQRDGK